MNPTDNRLTARPPEFQLLHFAVRTFDSRRLRNRLDIIPELFRDPEDSLISTGLAAGECNRMRECID